ncbi:MAG: hypothetical protein LBD69_02685 [Puniceicoccales bacterium]|jgi:hypothetical protein|nr:hypothetical protein [Puniceicoccales bacterium]
MCAIPIGGGPGVPPGVGGPGRAHGAGPAGGLQPGGGGGAPVVGGAPRPMAAPGAGNAAATLRWMEGKSHPHINNDNVMANVDAIMEPRGFDKAADAALFKHLQDQGIINKDGEIDFTKLRLSPREIKRAGLEGKVFVKEDGQLDFSIRGKCGESAVKALEGFKQAIEDFIKSQPESGDKITLQINPSNVATPSAGDLDVLRRGGQIQYWPGDTYTEKIDGKDITLQNTVKLTLDPGENGKEDGLTVDVLDTGGNRVHGTPKIPLDIVFGGVEHEGHAALKDGQPILPNWREQKLFEHAHVHVQQAAIGDPESNINDVARIQVENNLWSGVMDYLKVTSQTTVGVFNAGGAEDPEAVAAPARVDRNDQLNTLYGELRTYLAKPRDVTADGLGPFIKRLDDLKPEAGTPEAHLRDYLTALKDAVANPIRNAPPILVLALPEGLRDLLSPICEGLTELRNVLQNKGPQLHERYQAIKTADEDPATPIGQHCPTAAVDVAKNSLRGRVVDAVLEQINTADAADLSNVDNINILGTPLAQVDLEEDSNDRNQVGQALLEKLTADASPWRTMARDPDQIAQLQQQVTVFETNFPGVPVPDDIKNARVAVAPPVAPPPAAVAPPVAPPPPPPPPGAGDAVAGERHYRGSSLENMHLYTDAVVPAPIPKATAKAQLELMLQIYRDMCAYAETQLDNHKNRIRNMARDALGNILDRELSNINGTPVNPRLRTQVLNALRSAASTDDQCINALQQCIDACA